MVGLPFSTASQHSWTPPWPTSLSDPQSTLVAASFAGRVCPRVNPLPCRFCRGGVGARYRLSKSCAAGEPSGTKRRLSHALPVQLASLFSFSSTSAVMGPSLADSFSFGKPRSFWKSSQWSLLGSYDFFHLIPERGLLFGRASSN